MSNTTQLSSGSTLQGGKYRIEKVLGQGGFGITYEAEQVSLHRKVAIKEFFMKDYCNRDADTSQVSIGTSGSRELVEKFRAKFVKEAQLIAGLDHPNIIKIHDVFEEHGTAYYVMEYLGGGSLSSYVESKGRLPESEAIGFIRQVGSALSYIHGMSINHLDVKPGNILLDGKGRAVLIDFGLSKRYDDTGNQTSSTPVGISHGYAPLEQYKAGGVGTFSPTTDVYSLGATLYKLVTGQTPPDADVINDEGFAEWSADLSSSTVKAIEKAMQPRRKDRVQTVSEFLSMLTSSPNSQSRDESTTLDDTEIDATVLDAETSPKSKPQPKPQPESVGKDKPATSKKPAKWLISLFVSIGVLIGCGVGIWFYQTRPEPVVINESLNAKPVVQTRGTINGHEYVDLGLSVKWATCNVGASSPSDYGDYYAWGETNTKKAEYTYSNSITFRKSFSDISGSYTYDVARKKWGSSWRLPRKSEFQELKSKCTWEWTTQGSHKGYKVTGPNGNSIFLPAAGFRYSESLSSAEEYGDYWSSTPYSSDSDYANHLYFNSGLQDVTITARYFGQSVRPVSE